MGLRMSLHISLPPELENRLQHEVSSGAYGSMSDLIGAAVQNFFTTEDDVLSEEEKLWLRTEVAQRQEAIRNGSESWVDGEAFFNALERPQ